jgi:uracil-DNA glycosylase family 4
MFTIKQSYGKCGECRLIDEPSCILETNIQDGLETCEVLILAENPGKEEIEAERPLVGKSGKIFRDPFNKYIKDNFKYIITNSVLCLTLKPDGNTGNATPADVDRCKDNLFKLIEIAKPKVIISMGGVAMYAFGMGKDGIQMD